LNLWYLDDGTIGGGMHDILHDFDTIRRVGPTISLLLNENKCDFITNDNNVVSSIQTIMPNIVDIPCNAGLQEYCQKKIETIPHL